MRVDRPSRNWSIIRRCAASAGPGRNDETSVTTVLRLTCTTEAATTASHTNQAQAFIAG